MTMTKLIWPALVLMLLGLAVALQWPQSELRLERENVPAPPAGPDEVDTQWATDLGLRISLPPQARAPASQIQPLNSVELIGLVESDGVDRILIRQGGQSRSLALGDQVDGYELVDIRASDAVFDGEHGRVVLTLRN